jgi:hypothetical protein
LLHQLFNIYQTTTVLPMSLTFRNWWISLNPISKPKTPCTSPCDSSMVSNLKSKQ